jgi:CheY-like chemotaxis protein
MTKIMLVEDDKSLREIYGVRLLAEGYDIVSAGDGEEALAMAIKERPQLIVSDVMMPKISGFDMLDILRSTTETRDIKVIMMTALSSEEQRQRGESLGADRYLVKSQVGIEDVVRVVHEVLGDSAATAGAAQPAAPVPAPTPAAPVAPAAPTVPTPPAPVPVAPAPPVPAPTVPTPAAPVAPAAPTQPPRPASIKTRIIQPLNDPNTQPPDINQLLDKELAKEAGVDPDQIPTIQTADQERQTLEQELANFQAGDDANAITADPSISTPQSDDGVPPPPPPPPGAPNA